MQQASRGLRNPEQVRAKQARKEAAERSSAGARGGDTPLKVSVCMHVRIFVCVCVLVCFFFLLIAVECQLAKWPGPYIYIYMARHPSLCILEPERSTKHAQTNRAKSNTVLSFNFYHH